MLIFPISYYFCSLKNNFIFYNKLTGNRSKLHQTFYIIPIIHPWQFKSLELIFQLSKTNNKPLCRYILLNKAKTPKIFNKLTKNFFRTSKTHTKYSNSLYLAIRLNPIVRIFNEDHYQWMLTTISIKTSHLHPQNHIRSLKTQTNHTTNIILTFCR